jgi:hypothetical protein
MATATRSDRLERLSAQVTQWESFGRAVVAASLAAAAKEPTRGPTLKLRLDVTIRGIGADICVGIPGMGRFRRIERDDRALN